MIGEQVGNNVVISQLGEGAMGAVYLAEHPRIKTRVAIKFLLPHVSEQKDQVQRFFNEAIAIRRIKHSGIVDIFDVGFHGERAYLVMEALEGESLADRLRHAPRMPLAQITDICRQLASVLEATQQAGITHRDLKPANIFLVPAAEMPHGERVKVLDFGIAKLANAGALTATDSAMGTPHYMAPEQWRNAKDADWRADAYSLGCIAFELCTGSTPFVTESIAEACAKHLSEEPPRLRRIRPDLPVALEQLITKLLAKEPARRASSPAEITRAFDAITESAHDPTPPAETESIAAPAANPFAAPSGHLAVDYLRTVAEVRPSAAIDALHRFACDLQRRHRAGIAHGSLAAATITVEERADGFDLVAPSWPAEPPATVGWESPWKLNEPAAAFTDIRVLDDLVSIVICGHVSSACRDDDAKACPRPHVSVAYRGLADALIKSRDRRTRSAADSLDAITSALAGLATSVECAICGERQLAVHIVFSGRGGVCAPCARTLGTTPGAELDMVASEEEQEGERVEHRGGFLAALAGTVAMYLLATAAVFSMDETLMSLMFSRPAMLAYLVLPVTAVFKYVSWRGYEKRKALRESYRRGETPAKRFDALSADEAALELRRQSARDMRRRLVIGIVALVPIMMVVGAYYYLSKR